MDIDIIIAAAETVAKEAKDKARYAEDRIESSAAYAVQVAFDSFVEELKYLRQEAAKKILEGK